MWMAKRAIQRQREVEDRAMRAYENLMFRE